MKGIATIVLSAALSVTAATSHRAAAQTGVARLTHAQTQEIIRAGEWHRGCPVWPSQLRILSFRYRGFDRRPHIGQIVVNAKVAHPLARVFARIYALRFP